MKTQHLYHSKRLAAPVAHLVTGLCWMLASAAVAMPHWDVSNPGANGVLTPLAAKSGTLYLPYDNLGAIHLGRWTFGVGYEDLGVLFSPIDPPSIYVNAMCVQGNYIYVAGYFTIPISGGVQVTNIMKFDIANNRWAAVGDGTLTDMVNAVAVDSNGRVYVGAGSIDDRGAAVHNLLRYWDGSAWATVGSGMYGSTTELYGMGRVTALAASGTDIYAAGNFDAGVNGSSVIYSTNIIKWDGANWHAMGTPAGNGIVVAYRSGVQEFYRVAVSGSNVFVGGSFYNMESDTPVAPIGLDRFSTNCSHAQAYSLLVDTTNGTTAAALDVSARSGIVYVAGTFGAIDSTAITGVARWTDGSWSVLGSSGVNGSCLAATVDVDQAVVFVHGSFDHADSQAVPNGTPIRWIGP